MSDKSPNVYSESERLLGQTQAGAPLSQHSWDADRSSPLDTIRAMIRERISPELYPSTLAQCLVVDAAPQVNAVVSNVLGGGGADGASIIQPVRVRVLSDPRHYWLPEPKSPEDPTRGFHPIVLYIAEVGSELAFGDIVDVEFTNPETQFTSHMDVGRVLKVLHQNAINFDDDGATKGFLGEDCEIRSGEVEEIDPATGLGTGTTIAATTIIGCSTVESVGQYPTPARAAVRENEYVSFPKVKPAQVTIDPAVISGWDLNRTITIKGKTTTRPHRGTDFRAPMGTPIFAALDGMAFDVAQKEGKKGFGFYKVILHSRYALTEAEATSGKASIFFTLYAHMQDPSLHPIVANKTKVTRGQVIGLSADSGTSTGPHCHFEYITSGSKWEAGNPVADIMKALKLKEITSILNNKKEDPMTEFFPRDFLIVGE